MAWDYGGEHPVDAVLSRSTVELTLNAFRFSAPLPAEESDVVTGTVSCPLGPNLEAQGTWRMTRSR